VGSRDGGSAASLLQHGGRSFMGPSGPGWACRAWCALAAMSGQRLHLGGGGGFLPRGCEAVVSSPDDIVYLRWSGRRLVS
jgi:hypothetical protein